MLVQPRPLLLAPLLLGVCVACPSTVFGEPEVKPAEVDEPADADRGATESDDEEDEGPPKPERVEVETADGFLIVGKYFPAYPASADAAVLVMVADQGESHVVFDRLAESVRAAETERPIAVLTASLRGQGDSTRRRTID
ncbi:MAG: hypothetical protein AAF805_15245, partial [Planctomycetota bacterium]